MATTPKRSRPKKQTPVQAKPENQVKTLEIEINADEFTNEDYEILLDWSSGNAGGHPVAEIFDILDKVIVGGFRSRRFVDSKAIIEQMLTQLSEIAVGGDSKN